MTHLFMHNNTKNYKLVDSLEQYPFFFPIIMSLFDNKVVWSLRFNDDYCEGALQTWYFEQKKEKNDEETWEKNRER